MYPSTWVGREGSLTERFIMDATGRPLGLYVSYGVYYEIMRSHLAE